METKIKICGLKAIKEINIINQFEIDYAGFIFANSKRKVDIVKAKKLIKQLKKGIKKVGVFVDAPIEEVLETIKKCELDIVQLHGEENEEYVKQIPVKVWKTIPISKKEDLKLIEKYSMVDGILFETKHERLKGGTGTSFDWKLLQSLETKRNYKLILAGGISAFNITRALKEVKPDVIDINSKIEVDGFKTYEKIKQIFDEIRKGE